MKYIIIISLIFLLTLSCVVADVSKEITLLTVTDGPNETYIGGTATLHLRITEGNGAVYIDTFPLTKLDTQVATRTAQEIACDYAQVDCDKYNFFYTIRSSSSLVGGPSAGAATAIVTIAALEDLDLKPIAVTGAISSGGIIMPVGGVKEKVEGAHEDGVGLVVVPTLSLGVSSNLTNETSLELSDLQAYDDMTVVSALTIEEALSYATNIPVQAPKEIAVPEFYTTQMIATAQDMCERTSRLFETLTDTNTSDYTSALDFYNKSLVATDEEDYYSAASFCYSANIRLRTQLVKNMSQSLKYENLYRLQTAHNYLESQIDNLTLKTYSDFETFLVVKERLYETQEYITEINSSNISATSLAAGIERYNSAIVWSRFFGKPGKKLIIDEAALQQACTKKLRQAGERLNFLQTYLPGFFLDQVIDELNGANSHYDNDEYALCIFKASKAISYANLFFTQLDDERTKQVIDAKLARVHYQIEQQQQDGLFPILGYSYYEYAQKLKDDQTVTSLLFTEYALSLSDVNLYFPKAFSLKRLEFSKNETAFFALGFGCGVLLTILLTRNRSNRKPNKEFTGPRTPKKTLSSKRV